MKFKKCMVIYIAVCLTMGSLSGCKENEEKNSIERQSVHKSNDKEKNETQERENLQSVVKTEPKIVIADYGEEFQSIQGCAVIFEPSKDTYTFYNQEECKIEASPCSTFKVVSTLMGLHNKVVTSEESKMGYNGTEYDFETWNADLNLKDAFKYSCVWYFRKIIDEVGQEEVQKELTALNYGNCDISEWNGSLTNTLPELNGFWLDSSLKISPIEQVDILRSIIEGKSIYTSDEINILKNIMLISTNDSSRIYGKTGTGKKGNAWFVGFVENSDSNIYFAIFLNDSTSDEVKGSKAKEIALGILNESFISRSRETK